MSTIEDVKNAISELNDRYPRPGFTISVSGIYDIRSSFSEMYPNAPSPGVYILLSAEGVVLRIGKASCGSTLGMRLTAYFGWEDKSAGRGRAKDEFYREVCFIATIAVPKDRAFEAPAIEEFLLSRVAAPLNAIGVRSNITMQATCEDARA